MARVIYTDELAEGQALPADDASWIYNGLDCCVTFEILQVIKPQLDETTAKTYQTSLAKQAPVLDMKMRGLLVNEETRQQKIRLFTKQLEQVERQLNRICREVWDFEINPRSPLQVNNLLYGVLGLPVIRKRDSRGNMRPTSGRDALERLRYNFYAEPICNHLIKIREIGKALGFLKTGIDPDGRMRCTFNIAGTNTGRLSSSMSDYGTGTNLQNVDRDLRECFIADPGYLYLNIDLEQADSRNVGAICWNLFLQSHGPEFAGAYLDACESGDLHTTVCRMAWTNLAWSEDQSGWRDIADQVAYRAMSYRDLAKRLGHGTNYFGQPPTMAKHTKVDRPAVEEFQRNYFKAFPCIKAWHDWVIQEIKQVGYLKTLMGRRRFFFGRHNDDSTIREAIAYAPQGSTAEEIDEGYLQVWRKFPQVQLLVQVHDSILMQIPYSEHTDLIPQVLEAMKVELELEGGRKFHVPLEAKVGWNWGDVKYTKGKVSGNHFGLAKWKGKEERDPPARLLIKRRHSIWNN